MEKLSQHDERSLVTRLKNGDHRSFNLLFDHYGKKLYFFSLRYFHDPADAEEVVQEVFLKIWDQRDNLKEGLSFSSFLITISKNLIFNKLRKKVNAQAYEHYLLSQKNTGENTTENDSNFHLLNELISESIQAMPPQRQEVFKLSRQEGKDNSEIARRLNISKSTVENHLNKALKTVREFIKVGFSH